MGRFHFEEESSKIQRPCRGFRAESSARVDCPHTEPNAFSSEFGNGRFTAPEMKKIMENEKLVELAMADPKRVKRFHHKHQNSCCLKFALMISNSNLNSQDTSKSTISCSIEGAKDEVHCGIRTQSAGSADRNHHFVSTADIVASEFLFLGSVSPPNDLVYFIFELSLFFFHCRETRQDLSIRTMSLSFDFKQWSSKHNLETVNSITSKIVQKDQT